MNHMKKIIVTTFSIAAFAFLTACGDNAAKQDSKETAEEVNEQKFDNQDTERDAEFAVDAASGGMMEVQLGNLAQTNASSQQIKDFARQMVDEHSKANDELKGLAQQKNITLPAALSADHQKKYDDLAAKKGADFDKAYAAFMVEDHEDDLEDFREEADKGNDADVKAWAASKVPILEHHLEMAKTTRDAVK